MNQLNNPNLEYIIKKADKKYLDFVRQNARKLLKEANYDNESEIPNLPSFDKFLKDTLKPYLAKELKKKGYFNGAVEKLTKHYRNVFYYSSLPNLREQQQYL